MPEKPVFERLSPDLAEDRVAEEAGRGQSPVVALATCRLLLT